MRSRDPASLVEADRAPTAGLSGRGGRKRASATESRHSPASFHRRIMEVLPAVNRDGAGSIPAGGAAQHVPVEQRSVRRFLSPEARVRVPPGIPGRFPHSRVMLGGRALPRRGRGRWFDSIRAHRRAAVPRMGRSATNADGEGSSPSGGTDTSRGPGPTWPPKPGVRGSTPWRLAMMRSRHARAWRFLGSAGQSGVAACLSSRRSRVRIPSEPPPPQVEGGGCAFVVG